MKDYNLEFKSMYSNVLKNMCKLYEENERRDICLSCWMKTMKERNIEVLYNEEE